jgi:hypothetical protein
MFTATRTITIDPESELGKALADADETSVVLALDGVWFRVSRNDDNPWANYDPAKVRAGLRKIAGIISPEEADRLKEMIYRGREEGTRPIDRT